MKHYYVYILKCNDGSYYTGITSNLERRLTEHEDGKYLRCYTATKLPIELVFYERFYNPMHAIDFEKQVKGWSRKKKEALIERNWGKLKELSVCKNTTHYSFHGKASTPLSLTEQVQSEEQDQPNNKASLSEQVSVKNKIDLTNKASLTEQVSLSGVEGQTTIHNTIP